MVMVLSCCAPVASVMTDPSGCSVKKLQQANAPLMAARCIFTKSVLNARERLLPAAKYQRTERPPVACHGAGAPCGVGLGWGVAGTSSSSMVAARNNNNKVAMLLALVVFGVVAIPMAGRVIKKI